MNLKKQIWSVLLLFAALGQVYADEGMWVLKELNKQNLARMKELGFTPTYEQLYSETDPCVANAVVIFGGGCTGITVSQEGLIFTNHHCGSTVPSARLTTNTSGSWLPILSETYYVILSVSTNSSRQALFRSIQTTSII